MNQEDIVEERKTVYDLEERTFQFAKKSSYLDEKTSHVNTKRLGYQTISKSFRFCWCKLQ
jgi:hypothetical protein